MGDGVEFLKTAADDRLAIIGMGVDFPGIRTLDGILEAIFRGRPLCGSQPAWQPEGALGRAAMSAIQDSAWEEVQHHEIGSLLIGGSSQHNRFTALVNVTGPVMDFAGYSEPLPAMLVQAHEWLDEREVEAVVLAGSAEGEAGLDLDVIFGLDQSVHAPRSGSGAVAVVIMRIADARRLGLRVYAVLEALAYTVQSHPDGVASCAQSALRAAGWGPDEIGVLHATASGVDALDRQEIAGLCTAYRGESARTAIGSSQSLLGSLAGVNGLAGLVWTGLCLANRLRPAVNGWSGPKFLEAWSGSAFYVPVETLTWFQQETDGLRKAALNLIANDNTCAHLVLSGAPISQPAQPVVRNAGVILIPVGGSSAEDLLAGLEAVHQELQAGGSIQAVAARAYRRTLSASPASLAVFLVHNPTEALREVEFGLRGIPAAIEKGSDWQTPAGSYYTPNPLGPEARVAFVYPGAFNSYVGVGRDLFYTFPTIYAAFQAMVQDVGAILCDEQLYPRSLAPLDKARLEQVEAALLADANAMMVSGSGLSVVLTSIFRDIFRVEPYSALGYSLGENSMMFSLGVWGDGLHASRRLFASPLFHTRLAGPQNAVRAHWGLPTLSADAQPAQPLWENYLLMVPVDRVREALSGEPQVYLTHVNTPRQVVIGGDPTACRRVIDRLKCSSLKAPFDYVLHCEAMESEYQALYDIHSMPVKTQTAVKCYSAADDRPFVLSQSEIARAVAHDLCSMLDFPRLVETAYADGARFFIELGAGSNCAKWVEDILRGKPFLSVSANRKGLDDATSILRVLARLASHRIKVDLEPLYRDQEFHG